MKRMIDLLKKHGRQVVFKCHDYFLLWIFSLIIFALLVCSAQSEARVEEREKIVLENFPVSIEFKENQRKVAVEVASICRRRLPQLAGEIGLDSVSNLSVLLLDRVDDYAKRSSLSLPEWGAAFAIMERQFMLVDVKKAVSSWDALEKTIPHELSHLLLAQKVGNVPMPLWFVEGMAIWQAREWSLLDGWHLMNAVWGGKVMPVWNLANAFPSDAGAARVAYGVSYRAFLEIFSNAPVDRSLGAFLDDVKEMKNFDRAMLAFRGEGVSRFASEFDRELRRRYTSHLFFFQTGPLFSILAVLFLFVALIVKLKSRRRLRELEKREMGLSLDE